MAVNSAPQEDVMDAYAKFVERATQIELENLILASPDITVA